MQDFGDKLIVFMNLDPVFKGSSIIIVSLLSLLFAKWLKARWQEPFKGGFLVFVGIATFTLFYGLFILLIRPHWWALPY
ncbi:hypothetical protein HZB07_04810 [Candidatus Saganbacteria bacterium]|nr:hypothetical protein [Candidatus Saganbacteria bacterium]